MFKAGTPIRSIMGNIPLVVVVSNDTHTIVRSHDWSYARSIDNAGLEKNWKEDKLEECCHCKWYEAAPFANVDCGVCWKHTVGDFGNPACWVQGIDSPCKDFKRRWEE